VILLRNAVDLIKTIKQIVKDTISSMRMADIVSGMVISTSPLQIKIDQKLILYSAQISLTCNVKNYQTEISINGGMKQNCTIYNDLKVGDKVKMIRQNGGQHYLVIDKE